MTPNKKTATTLRPIVVKADGQYPVHKKNQLNERIILHQTLRALTTESRQISQRIIRMEDRK